jgi:hypothetical protein
VFSASIRDSGTRGASKVDIGSRYRILPGSIT